MSRSEDQPQTLMWAVMVVAIVAGAVLSLLIVRLAPTDSDIAVINTAGNRADDDPMMLGVTAKITAGDLTVERSLPALAFSLEPGQSLDARLPSGPFRAELTVRFLPGAIQQAFIGAEFQGGSLIVRRGEEPPLLSDFAGAEGRTTLTRQPIGLTRRQQTLTYTFQSDGKTTCRLRALWQPVESIIPLALPSAGSLLLEDPALAGMTVYQQLNCAACHRSGDEALQSLVAVNPSPVLGHVGARIRPEWIRNWLRDPAAVKAPAAMPRQFHGGSEDAEQIEDLAHFLVAMGGPIDDPRALPNAELVDTGRLQYHTVGCFACHGPLEPRGSMPGGRAAASMVTREYVPLGRVAEKTTPQQLAGFLKDPVAVHPGGGMPSMNLDDLEADAIAAYLFAHDLKQSRTSAGGDSGFAIDPARVERGRSHFASVGCANCHALGPDRSAVASTLKAPSLESIAASQASTGCIAATASGESPHFALSQTQRDDLMAFLHSVPARRCQDVPVDRLATSIARLNCTACHQFNGERGPEPAVAQYFSTVIEADLGDEGRIPPMLSDVGAKLNPHWMLQVLTEAGQARPYMGARMPQAGAANVSELPGLLAAASGVAATPEHGPAGSADLAKVGRELVGSKGLNCIQCHNVAGRDSTGTPGPDLAQMAERLRFSAFARWVHDPKLTRPGTRMPSFFVDGYSGFTQYLGGEASKQIDAMWAYLAQGEFMALPEGLVDPASLALQVTTEPIVFRTFMKQAGVRAIACGYPEQIHCAYDAERCRLAMVWNGEFLNASGAWAARGGTETNPTRTVWSVPADDTPLIRIVAQGGARVPAAKFQGYELDAERRPTFMCILTLDDVRIDMREQPVPGRTEARASLVRRISLAGPPNTSLLIHRGELPLANSSVRTNDRGDGTVELSLDSQGKASFELEVAW